MTMEEHINIVGHSFTRKLHRYVRRDKSRRNFGLARAKVWFAGNLKNGDKIVMIHDVAEWRKQNTSRVKNCHLTILEIASNDLLIDFVDRPVALAKEVIYQAKRLKDGGCPKVVITEALFRDGLNALPKDARKNVTQEDIDRGMEAYNDNVLTFNRSVKYLLDKEAKARRKQGRSKLNIWFGKLRGLRDNWQERCIDRDRVHLKQSVMNLHYNNHRRFIQYQTPNTTEL